MSDSASGGRRFIHEYFADEDRDLYYELDSEGFAVRNLDSGEPYEVVSAAAFETVWSRHRAPLERRWTSGGKEAYERGAASAPRWRPLKERGSS